MDIRKEWESCLRTPEVHALFETLRENEKEFGSFSNLEQWVAQMRQRSPRNCTMQDACLWILVRRIQLNLQTSAALSLLTYLLSPGLQVILKEMSRWQRSERDTWSEVWWSFLQTVLKYPLDRRRHKVAANLMMDTRGHLLRGWRKESRPHTSIEDISERELASYPHFDEPLQTIARALIEDEGTDLSQTDHAIVIGTRVYGEDLHDVANRLGISYEAARKRRQRIEQKLRRKWEDEG